MRLFRLNLLLPQRRFLLSLLFFQEMPGNVQYEKPVPSKTDCSRLTALLLPPFQRFPFFLLFLLIEASFFCQPLPLLLIFLPFLPAKVTDRLRSGLAECPLGVVARLELAEPLAQPGHTEIPVHAGRLDRRVAHKNHRAGTLAGKTQTDCIQPGVKLFPA